MRWHLGLALGLLLGVAALGATPAWAAQTWEGTWSSTFGEIKMTAGGSGTYPNCGTISGGLTDGGQRNAGTWQECSSNGKYEFFMSASGGSFTGSYTRGESETCVSPPCTWNGTCIAGPCTQNAAEDPEDPKGPRAKVTRVSGDRDVRVKRKDGSFRALKAGDTVGPGVELYTGIDSEITLEFPDGSVMTIKEMSQVLISDLISEGSRQMIRVAIKLGELDASVNPRKAFQADFKVVVPTATAGVRGTKFSVFYDPANKLSLLSVREGTVAWDPVKAGQAEVTVTAGQEIQATPKRVSAPAAIGMAGARGGTNMSDARDLVLARVDKKKKSCKLKPARSPSAVAVDPVRRGWLVAVKIAAGKVEGKSTWTVRSGKARPKNRLARKINRGCT